jgi:hypothetical protein
VNDDRHPQEGRILGIAELIRILGPAAAAAAISKADKGDLRGALDIAFDAQWPKRDVP